jgi:hypothetical protein
MEAISVKPPRGRPKEEARAGPRGHELRHVPRQAVPPEEARPCEYTEQAQEEASGKTQNLRQAGPKEDSLYSRTVLQLDQILQEDRHEVRQTRILIHGVHPHSVQPYPHEEGIEIGSYHEHPRGQKRNWAEALRDASSAFVGGGTKSSCCPPHRLTSQKVTQRRHPLGESHADRELVFNEIAKQNSPDPLFELFYEPEL